jgi:hypothetical protein
MSSSWEQYQFLRYYMPGFLFFTYLAIMLVSARLTFEIPDIQTIVGIFGGIIIASPVIGYIIYIPYNCFYERIWSRSKKREVLNFMTKAIFEEKLDAFNLKEYERAVKNFGKKKELIDLILHIDIKNEGAIKVNNEILNTLQNQLNNFSARVVMGFFTPIASTCVLIPIIIVYLGLNGNAFFNFASYAFAFSVIGILVISILLLMGVMRVLTEAFILENYIVCSRQKEARIIIAQIFNLNMNKEKIAVN